MCDSSGSTLGGADGVCPAEPAIGSDETIGAIENERTLNALLRTALQRKPLREILLDCLDILLSVSWLSILPKGGVLLVQDEADVLHLVAHRNLSPELLKLCASVPFGRCLCGQAAAARCLVHASCMDERHEITYEGIQPHGHYNVPLLDGGNVIGVLVLYLTHGHGANEVDIRFLKAAADIFSLVVRQKRLEHDLFNEARASKQKSIQLEATISNMPQGLCVYDSEQRLLVRNDRYIEIYELPRNLAVLGTNFRSILAQQKSAGNFDGDIERFIATRLAGVTEGQSISDTVFLADGRTIAVVTQAMQGGGWVSIHDDITDKIKSEMAREEKKKQLDAALENMSHGLSMFDADQRLIVCNRHYGDIYGLEKELMRPGTAVHELRERRNAAGVVPEDYDKYVEAHITGVKRNQPIKFTNQLEDGRFISVVYSPTSDGGWVATHEDITERIKVDKALARAHKELKEKQFAIDQAVIVGITDVKGNITYVNDNFCRISGYTREELIGANHRMLRSDSHSKAFFRDMYRWIASGRVWRGEVCNKAKNGSLYWVDTTVVPQLGANGKPIAYMSIRIDITARRVAEAKISYMANHDALTGVRNRAFLIEKLKEALNLSQQDQERFAVLLLDLDGFKHVNDTLGHAAGDDLLKELVSRLKSTLHESDTLARLGGDEFAIIQRGQPNPREAAIALAVKLLEIAAMPFNLDGHSVVVGTSIGIALGPEDGTSPGELLQKADLALYRVKSEGRNNFRFFDEEMSENAAMHLQLLNDLRAGLAHNQFELHYQPMLDAKTRQLCGVEALVRWSHPVKGLISPDRFIPLAEEAGLMGPLGGWILEKACRDAAQWPERVKVAVNLSAAQFRTGKLFDVILCALVDSGLPPERLELEITESVLMDDEQNAAAVLQQLKNIGISVALDDFGTGYSSLSYLTKFRFDKIKIDKSFTGGLSDRADCAAIVASVLTLARGLDILVTAEGVETDEQYELLRVAGIHQVQGYLFGHPSPATELNFSKLEQKGRSHEAA